LRFSLIVSRVIKRVVARSKDAIYTEPDGIGLKEEDSRRLASSSIRILKELTSVEEAPKMLVCAMDCLVKHGLSEIDIMLFKNIV
jgi:hypothetical protein